MIGTGEGTFPSVQIPAQRLINRGNLPVRGDIGSMCIGSSGKPDYTSLFVALLRLYRLIAQPCMQPAQRCVQSRSSMYSKLYSI